MANQEHLEILRQGVEVWNKWREEHFGMRPDLTGASLAGADFSFANLRETNFAGADLGKASLMRTDLLVANLRESSLAGADFRKANLTNANLMGADLSYVRSDSANLLGANLSYANLTGANLSHACLIGADLRETNFNGAILSNANLTDANLTGARLAGAYFGWTSLGDRDLRVIKGLETALHTGPSPLSINTIYLSGGDIPEIFLRGTGVPDIFIGYMHSFVGKPIEFYSCFISYSSKDHAFAERLYADLQNNNVRCWYAPGKLIEGLTNFALKDGILH